MTQVTTVSGQIFAGRLISGGDFRSQLIRLSTDPLRVAAVQEIDKKQIEEVRTMELSLMPEGLLNTFMLDEIRDLLAWLER